MKFLQTQLLATCAAIVLVSAQVTSAASSTAAGNSDHDDRDRDDARTGADAAAHSADTSESAESGEQDDLEAAASSQEDQLLYAPTETADVAPVHFPLGVVPGSGSSGGLPPPPPHFQLGFPFGAAVNGGGHHRLLQAPPVISAPAVVGHQHAAHLAGVHPLLLKHELNAPQARGLPFEQLQQQASSWPIDEQQQHVPVAAPQTGVSDGHHHDHIHHHYHQQHQHHQPQHQQPPPVVVHHDQDAVGVEPAHEPVFHPPQPPPPPPPPGATVPANVLIHPDGHHQHQPAAGYPADGDGGDPLLTGAAHHDVDHPPHHQLDGYPHGELQDNAVAPITAVGGGGHQSPGLPAPVAAGTVGGSDEEAWPLSQPDMPKIVHLDVKCEKNLMKVVVEFDRPFNGLIFSKGHYSYGSCVHLPAGSGQKSVFFDISINSCGTVGNAQNGLYGQEGNTATGSFFENTIIVQYDPQVQEVWDQARKLRCTWHNNYEKAVTFRPFPVDMLDVVRADFAGDNVGCWMQIQAGKGPWASEVAGIVKIGQTMTMVLAIKDDENKFDMLVRNCIAHDGQRAPIELVDSKGCVARPKLMSRFTKIKNFGSSATVLSYAHFQAFKFPDTMEVHFQCTIQICRYQCPEQCAQDDHHALASDRQTTFSTTLSRQERDLSARFRRDTNPPTAADKESSSSTSSSSTSSASSPTSPADAEDHGEKDIGVSKIIRVLSAGDVDFNLGNSTRDQDQQQQQALLEFSQQELSSMVCMSTLGFASVLMLLLVVLVVTCVMCAFLYIRHKQGQLASSPSFKVYPHDLPVFTKKPPTSPPTTDLQSTAHQQ